MGNDLTSEIKFKHEALLQTRLSDPFSFLGRHQSTDGWTIRAFSPYANRISVWVTDDWVPMKSPFGDGVFDWHGKAEPPMHYRLRVEDANTTREIFDPYSFPSTLSEHDLYLFAEGNNYQAHGMLGAHFTTVAGVSGVRFAVWAPNAERVSVVGDFNRWDGRLHPMRPLGGSGTWELFVPELVENTLYRYEIRNRFSGELLIKSDPYAQAFEMRPGTASKIARSEYEWRDAAWLKRRAEADWLHSPTNIYEVHLGSWQRSDEGGFLSYAELAKRLLPYVQDMGYTHIELMPISEHPLDESWGYQTTGYFAVTSRYGSPDEFRAFVDVFHQAGIGVILDWVPAHFPTDAWALSRFDGTALYEHEDPRLGFHQDWGTHIFNYGRREVRSFLLSSAHFWLSECHIDGLRVDAVASMLYLDYSRKHGEWLPNCFGGRENLEAIEFLRLLNVMVHNEFPGALTFAEESTAWPMVSRPVYLGGLGFSMKWNMGWMNDTLSYMQNDPIHRRFHHHQLTFGQIYSYSENFVLPLSHDEVVHGKRSLLDKMPGDAWQKFANLRLLFAYQLTTPGKKLNFMGGEFGQGAEWAVTRSLDWHLLDIDWHRGVKALHRDLNRLYQSLSALHEEDFSQEGFAWVECQDADQSTLAYLRRARDASFVLVALNFTPVPRHSYRVGVPEAGIYREILNSDAACYGGSNVGNSGLQTENVPWGGFPFSLSLVLPPLAGIILQKIQS